MINNKIINYLESRKISIRTLAENVGMSYTGFYQLLKMNNDMKLSVLKKISDYLGVPITYWFEDENKQINIASNNSINGNNNKIEVQLKQDIEKLQSEIEILKVELRLKNELIESLRAHIKSLMKLDK